MPMADLAPRVIEAIASTPEPHPMSSTSRSRKSSVCSAFNISRVVA